MFKQEKYIEILSPGLMHSFLKFRTLNHKLPVQKGRIQNIPRPERLCTKCNDEDIGDEFHYIMKCPFFYAKRKELIPIKYWKYPNVLNFEYLFCSENKTLLIKLVLFIKIIMAELS